MKTSLIASLIIALALVGCEPPEIEKPEPEVKVVEEKPPVAEPAPVASNTDADAPKATEAPEEKEMESGEPLMKVTRVGDTITVAGSIKGFGQKRDIIRYLNEGFPNLKIVDELEANPNRMPVGWGNRVSDGYLVPFFKQVGDGVVEYKDRIVYLEGTVDDQAMFTSLVKQAGFMFMGDFTENIDSSKLVVEGK